MEFPGVSDDVVAWAEASRAAADGVMNLAEAAAERTGEGLTGDSMYQIEDCRVTRRPGRWACLQYCKIHAAPEPWRTAVVRSPPVALRCELLPSAPVLSTSLLLLVSPFPHSAARPLGHFRSASPLSPFRGASLLPVSLTS